MAEPMRHGGGDGVPGLLGLLTNGPLTAGLDGQSVATVTDNTTNAGLPGIECNLSGVKYDNLTTISLDT